MASGPAPRDLRRCIVRLSTRTFLGIAIPAVITIATTPSLLIAADSSPLNTEVRNASTNAPCGGDDWPTWAHDYNRSCMSTIAVGDPCEIRPAWRVDLQGYNSFCEPTIADGRVYISTDTRFSVFELASGTLINSIESGSPVMFDSNRANSTINGGRVFLTLGSAQSISMWDSTLTTAYWSNGSGTGVGPLEASAQFGVTAVYDVSGTEVVVVGTEGGHLWCFRTSDGGLFSGWPTNPVILDYGILHSPAYDGDDLYVGTSNSNFAKGSIYRIDAATGQIVWNWMSSPDKRSYPNGVSLEGDYVYAASANGNFEGMRFKLSKGGTPIWGIGQSRSLYGPPAYDSNFLYIPRNDVSFTGVLMVDKANGSTLYYFGNNGIGSVPQHVTLSCDGYMFCGDRNGSWWLSDIANRESFELHRSPGDIVNGTALATDPATGIDYAVVSIRSGNPTNGGGQLLAYQLKAGARPQVETNTPAVNIDVPYGAPTTNVHTETAVLTNTGCADLIINSHNITDPSYIPVVQAYDKALSRYAATVAGTGNHTSYFGGAKSNKFTIAMNEVVDGELTRGDLALDRARPALLGNKRRARRLQAEANTLHTSGVSYSPTVPPGQSTDVSWTWESTGLLRGTDLEVIEFVTNDPDRVLFGDQPTLTISYIGGCRPDSLQLNFGDITPDKSEQLYNSGRIGNIATSNDLVWQGVTGHLFDGTFILCGDSLVGDAASGQGGVQFHASFYDAGGAFPSWPGTYLPNPRPSDGTCGFDGDQDIHLGYKRVGGCPGTPAQIRGEWVRSYYFDTNQTVPGGTPLSAIGVEVTQTEIGAHDPLYGDFKLIRWDLHNRDAVEKTLHAGSLMDWDVGQFWDRNNGFVSDAFNGYAIWNGYSPTVAFGMFEPKMPTDFSTIDPKPHSPHRIHLIANSGRLWGYSIWGLESITNSADDAWDFCVNYTPTRDKDPTNSEEWWEDTDLSALLINEPLVLPAGGDVAMHQVLFGVDGTSADSITIKANVLELAERAAKWAGFARGDVNDDGTVDIQDVCWLLSGHQLYPDEYNGDVDLSGVVDTGDQDYLLQYVTGLGPAPPGAWRFTF